MNGTTESSLSPDQSPVTRKPQLDQMSFYSYGTKSMGGFAMTLASKINMALQRLTEEDDDAQDLIAILEELNLHTDLTVKLNNQSKLCKILQQSPDIKVDAVVHNYLDQSQQAIKGLLEDSKKQLEQLQQEKETTIEEFLE